MTKTAFQRKRTLFPSIMDLNLSTKPGNCYTFYGVENWTLQNLDGKYLEHLRASCRRRVEKNICTDRVKHYIIQMVTEERNILKKIKRRNVNWIIYILLSKRLRKRVIKGKKEGRIEVTGRRGIRRQQLLIDLKEKKGYRKLKQETLEHTLWRTRFGRCYGLVVRQTTE